jgi:4-amino-4-deoxy-L-arabinose transferase-like glycosyltransferase
VAALHAWRARHHGARGGVVLLAWALAMAVPLSLSRGKIDYYLLPLYPPLCLVAGAHLARERWSVLERAWARAVLAACAALLAALPLLAARFPADWLPAPGTTLAVALLMALGALACGVAALRPRPSVVAGTLAAVSAAVLMAAAAVLVPAFAAAQPGAAVVRDVQRERVYRPDAAVVACDDEPRVQRDVLFYARVAVQEQCDLWAVATSSRPSLLLLRAPELLSLKAIDGLREVGTYRYVPATALTLRGLRGDLQPRELALVANFATTDPVAEGKRKRERKRALRAEAEATRP